MTWKVSKGSKTPTQQQLTVKKKFKKGTPKTTDVIILKFLKSVLVMRQRDRRYAPFRAVQSGPTLPRPVCLGT